MYTRPSKAEQCLHNVLKVVEALRHIGVDYDIQVSQGQWYCYQGVRSRDKNPITIFVIRDRIAHFRYINVQPEAIISLRGSGEIVDFIWVYSPEPGSNVYCFRLNFNISK